MVILIIIVYSFYSRNDPESLISCPYNKAHMVRICGMQYHLGSVKKGIQIQTWESAFIILHIECKKRKK